MQRLSAFFLTIAVVLGLCAANASASANVAEADRTTSTARSRFPAMGVTQDGSGYSNQETVGTAISARSQLLWLRTRALEGHAGARGGHDGRFIPSNARAA
jgi:hypothetical protein